MSDTLQNDIVRDITANTFGLTVQVTIEINGSKSLAPILRICLCFCVSKTGTPRL